MVALATVTGAIYANQGTTLGADVGLAGAVVRFAPRLLDEVAAISDSSTRVSTVVGTDGTISPVTLWPGWWDIILPDGEKYTAQLLAGAAQTLLGLRVAQVDPDTLAPSGTTLTAWVASGAGMPEGVVTAPVGSEYVDSAATCGAVKWIKASGAGNTGWEVAYGDTGWRDIRSLLSANAAAYGNGPTDGRIRRVGVLVYYEGAVKPAGSTIGATRANPVTGIISGVPSGFASDNYIAQGTANWNGILGTANFDTNIASLDVTIAAASGTWVSTDGIGISAKWPACQPWPTFLPGTPA